MKIFDVKYQFVFFFNIYHKFLKQAEQRYASLLLKIFVEYLYTNTLIVILWLQKL